jgi:hypothetical protein
MATPPIGALALHNQACTNATTLLAPGEAGEAAVRLRGPQTGPQRTGPVLLDVYQIEAVGRSVGCRGCQSALQPCAAFRVLM